MVCGGWWMVCGGAPKPGVRGLGGTTGVQSASGGRSLVTVSVLGRAARGILMLRLTVAAFFLGPALGGLLLGVLALFIERKLIGIAQKRLGISFLGRNG